MACISWKNKKYDNLNLPSCAELLIFLNSFFLQCTPLQHECRKCISNVKIHSIAVEVSPACFYSWRAFVNTALLRLHWRISRFHIYVWRVPCVHLWRAHTFSRSTHSSSTSPCSLCLVFSRLEHLACVASAASSASCRRANSFFLQWTLVTHTLTPSEHAEELNIIYRRTVWAQMVKRNLTGFRLLHWVKSRKCVVQKKLDFWFGSGANIQHVLFKTF